jgi:polyisoprenoid-binding protein YceI
MRQRSLAALFVGATLAVPPGTPTWNRAPHTVAAVRYVVAQDGNEARYRVREQLLHHDLPNDAIGTTAAITGGLTLSPAGKIDSAASKITIDVRPLKSDQDRRDGYVQRRLLQTDQYPTVEFVPTSFSGVSLPLKSDEQSFDIAGLLTVRNVTHPIVWHVKAKSTGADLTGTGETKFTFADISLDQPHVPVVLSVADTIKLESDFHLVRQP